MTIRKLPFHWLLALVAFVIYALTLAHGVTWNSLPLTAKMTGWDWLPMTSHPLTWLLTLPLRLLPEGWIPLALNFCLAGIAALTLGLVARTVELLPWDYQPDGKKIWAARLPAILACIVCGLEFNFWQEAISGTGEMVELLLLVAAVWCLAEHYQKKEKRWLDAAIFLWGMGMAENWAMILLLPLFVASLIKLRGLLFFQRGFLLRALGLGLAGFSVFVLLPMVNGLSPDSPLSFGEAWLATLVAFKSILRALFYNFWLSHRLLTICLLLYFLVPILPGFVSLKDEGTANKAMVDQLQTWIYRMLRLILLLICVWLVFDPDVGPRQVIRQKLGATQSLLTFDYLNALGIAFLAGNIFFLTQIPPRYRPWKTQQKIVAGIRRNGAWIFSGLILLLVAGLVCRNLPTIRLANREPLDGYGELVMRSLPPGGGVVIGENATALAMLQAAWAHHASAKNWQAANLMLIPSIKYRQTLQQQSAHGWLPTTNTGTLKTIEMLQLLDQMARTNRIYFLEPHNGNSVFELFQPQPLAAVSELKPYHTNRPVDLRLTAEQVAANEKFWDDAWRENLALIAEPRPRTSALWKTLHRRLALSPQLQSQKIQLGQWYSVLLNDWGVVLQRNGNLTEASRRFGQALMLNKNNVAATMNAACCSNLLAGTYPGLNDLSHIADGFRNIQQLAQTMSKNGTMDNPAICLLLGNACAANRWPRQACLEFERASRLAPESILPDFTLAQIYSRIRFDDETLATVNRLRAKMNSTNASPQLDLNVSLLEARAFYFKTNLEAAKGVLETFRQKYPDNGPLVDTIFKSYILFGETTNALQMVDERLAKNPDEIAMLNNRGVLLIQMGRATEALPVLDHALALTNAPYIRLSRAFANLQLQNLMAAKKDYMELANNPDVDTFTVHYGLAKIATIQRDTNAAIGYYEFCLSNAPTNSLKWKTVHDQLAGLKKTAAP